MYSYFKGAVKEIHATHIVFETNNIGYEIRVPNPYQFEIDKEMTIYLYYHIREDAHELFGFALKENRDMFKSLLSVKGLGPKGALAILATSSSSEILAALDNSNAKFFAQFPGIGPKLSQQIVLDLKGKINFEDNSSTPKISDKLNNVTIALKSLGYTNQEIKSATKDLNITEDTPLSEAVKEALKRLKKN